MPNFNERLQALRVGNPQVTTTPEQVRQPVQQQPAIDPNQRLAGLRLGGVDQNQLNQTQGFQGLAGVQSRLDGERSKLREDFKLPLNQRI